MTLRYWSDFSKRINSTKRPATADGTTVTVRLKMPCSHERPVFELSTVPKTINYIQWDGCYYYVSDLTYVNRDIMQITCDLDVLATYKSNILDTKAFVEYSDYAYNVNLLDPRISTTYDTVQATSALVPINFTIASGTYILTCVSDSGVAVRYLCTYSQLQALGDYISSTMTDSVADTFIKKFGSVFNCILNCTWVPFDFTGAVSGTIKLGGVDTGISCKTYWPLWAYASDLTVSIPWINSGENIARRENEHIELFLPGYGSVTLSPSVINYASSLTITPYFDHTGSLTYIVKNGTGFKALFNCNCGVPIAVTQFTESVRGKLLSTFTSGAESAYQYHSAQPHDSINTAYFGFMAKINGRARNVGAVTSSVGGQGGGATIGDMINDGNIKVINTSFKYSASQETMEDRYGRPEFAVHTLTNFTGYVQTNGASVDIPGYEEEKNKVCALLNSGIFIE